MRVVTLVALALCIAALCGCHFMEPPYRAEAVEFDESLVGDWAWVSKNGEVDSDGYRFHVEERRVDVLKGRINPELGGSDGDPVRAYEITATGDGRKPTFKFHAYLLRAGEHTFLGIQPDPKELERVAPFPMVLPLHFIFEVGRKGDRVLIYAAKGPALAWVPVATGWLDAAPDQRPIDLEPGDKPLELILTNSIDRLLQVCCERADRKDLADDEPGVLARLRPDGAAGTEPR